MMIPVARSEKLLIQSVGNEVIIYDEVNNTSHCLNPMAAKVWSLCDGQHSVKDIAQLLEKELDVSQTEDVDMRGLVWLTLEELERYQLIKEYLKQPTKIANISRREVVKAGVLVSGFAIGSMFPVIKSTVAPAPAMAASVTNKFVSERGESFIDPNEEGGDQKAKDRAQEQAKNKAQEKCKTRCGDCGVIGNKVTRNDCTRRGVATGKLRWSCKATVNCRCGVGTP